MLYVPNTKKKALQLIPVRMTVFVSPDKDPLLICPTFLRKKKRSMRKFTEVIIQHQAMLADFLHKVFNLTFFRRKIFYIHVCIYKKLNIIKN